MIGNDELGKGVALFQDDMATVLTDDDEAGLLQGSDALAAGDPREMAHTATRMESNFSAGTGKPWS